MILIKVRYSRQGGRLGRSVEVHNQYKPLVSNTSPCSQLQIKDSISDKTSDESKVCSPLNPTVDPAETEAVLV